MPGGKVWGRSTLWTEEEVAVVRANRELTSTQLAELLPGRTASAVRTLRLTGMKAPGSKRNEGKIPLEFPAVKPPGDYVEVLSSYLTDEFEEMGIWLKWNGYAASRELSRTREGWVTVLCTAK